MTNAFTTTGTIDHAYSWFDEAFHWFMQTSGVRAGALAVVKGPTALVHRGYTFAEPGYPITQPDSRFRLASVSKMLTSAAITQLEATGRLSWSTQAFPLLVVTQPRGGMPRDPSMDSITIRELVDHTAGLQHGIDNREISHKLGLLTAPSRRDIIEYVYGTPRFRIPGAGISHRYFYSNFGYVILTSVVERSTGTHDDFATFLRREILGPMGLTDVWVGRTVEGGALPGEVSYDAVGSRPSVFEPNTSQLAPNAYGGTFALENSEGAGGLVSTAPTIARLISKYAVWGSGYRVVGRRYGSFDGTWTCAESLANGIDYAFLFNHNVSQEVMDSFANHVGRFLDPDQFPRQAPPGWVAHG